MTLEIYFWVDSHNTRINKKNIIKKHNNVFSTFSNLIKLNKGKNIMSQKEQSELLSPQEPREETPTITSQSELITTTPKSDDQNAADPQPEQQPQLNQEQDEFQNNLTLPISKIKKIFKMDPEYTGASASAVYTAGLATELFVQYFAEQASLLAKMEKRKKIQYKDFSNAVASHDALNFLSDTIPRTQPVGELVQQKKINVKQTAPKTTKDKIDDNTNPQAGGDIVKKDLLAKGQQTLNFPIANSTTSLKTSETPVKKSVILNLVSTEDDRSTTGGDDDIVMKD